MPDQPADRRLSPGAVAPWVVLGLGLAAQLAVALHDQKRLPEAAWSVGRSQPQGSRLSTPVASRS